MSQNVPHLDYFEVQKSDRIQQKSAKCGTFIVQNSKYSEHIKYFYYWE
ncbi:MAG: hypothetical protein WC596_04935 [Candidatus Shapirobacteria bacterium]